MAKRASTEYLEEALLTAVRAEGYRSERSEAEVVDDVLRRHLEFLLASDADGAWARNASGVLTGDQALGLAYDELKAMRRKRGKAEEAAF
jgi:hypothetical protein